jgi:HEAT repeat protein
MLEDDDEGLRALAATNLGKYVYLGEVDSISKQKKGEIESSLFEVTYGTDSPLVRRKALESLGYSSHQDVPNLITDAYKSNQDDWVSSALQAMGRTIDMRWEPEILEMLRSPNQGIQFEAIRAAGEIELTSTRPILLDLLHSGNKNIRKAAVWSLAQIGGENLLSVFEDMLQQVEDQAEVLIIEEAIDHLVFNQSINDLPDLDFPSLGENKDN